MIVPADANKAEHVSHVGEMTMAVQQVILNKAQILSIARREAE